MTGQATGCTAGGTDEPGSGDDSLVEFIGKLTAEQRRRLVELLSGNE
jgi:hypothetical protein